MDYSNLSKEFTQLLSTLLNNIADKIAERVRKCYQDGREYSIVTITDVIGIVEEEIKEYARQEYDDEFILLRNKLIMELDTDFYKLYELLAGAAIYDTDWQIWDLERDKEHFFSRNSLLSENPKFNEELRKIIGKVTLLNHGTGYTHDPDNGIYIKHREIEEINLSDTHPSNPMIQSIDFRRLRHCRSLKKIILGPKVTSISHLEELIHHKAIKIYYDANLTPEVTQEICHFEDINEDYIGEIFVLRE